MPIVWPGAESVHVLYSTTFFAVHTFVASLAIAFQVTVSSLVLSCEVSSWQGSLANCTHGRLTLDTEMSVCSTECAMVLLFYAATLARFAPDAS